MGKLVHRENVFCLNIGRACFKIHSKQTRQGGCLLRASNHGQDMHEASGFIQGHSESQKTWEALLIQLVPRKLICKGILIVTSHACLGFTDAIDQVLPNNKHHRLLYHNVGNLKAKRLKYKSPLIEARIDQIYYGQSFMNAKPNARTFTGEYTIFLPGPVQSLEKDSMRSLRRRQI